MNPAARPTRVIGGRYVVLAALGRGGMGVVWRAEDRVSGRQVAVKELRLPTGLCPEARRLFRERLLREARTAGRLDDPGIVTVYDVVTDDGIDHIVMELVEAPTLAAVVATSGPLDECAATAAAGQLLAALRTAHDNGVVHRDVRPSNVMLGPCGRVTLTDFAIAQAADDPQLATTGLLVGSPGYMAPERLEGEPATPASDLWALGATLFHAVQGAGPFARETTAATISAVLHAEVPPTRTRGPLGSVIAGLLQRAPQARLSGVQAAALLAAQDTAPLVSASASGEATATPTAPRRRRWVWLAAALVVGLAAGLLGGLVLPRLGEREVPAFSYGDGGDLPIVDVPAGSCLQGPLTAGQQFPAGSTVSCTTPHDLEVFRTLDPFDPGLSAPYPGREQLTTYATVACTLVFESDAIDGADKDRLQVAVLVPSQASFEADAARGVICLLRAADGSPLTGTRIAEAPR